MKRDWTVTLSRWLFVTMLVGSPILVLLDLAWGIRAPDEILIFVAVPVLAAVIRFIVLWFQTFIHVLRNARGHSQIWWALAHVFFGPIASDLYYEGCTTTKSTLSSEGAPSDER
jgi:hypothetical protein